MMVFSLCRPYPVVLVVVHLFYGELLLICALLSLTSERTLVLVSEQLKSSELVGLNVNLSLFVACCSDSCLTQYQERSTWRRLDFAALGDYPDHASCIVWQSGRWLLGWFEANARSQSCIFWAHVTPTFITIFKKQRNAKICRKKHGKFDKKLKQ